jgi:protein-tyrosine phosphatase/arsenate reductase
MIPSIEAYCHQLTGEFHSIPESRKQLLEKLTEYIRHKLRESKPVQLVYVCTHNSRRSHFGQVWAQVAASYYHVPHVCSFSGGTEATAFHPNAIRTLERIGFQIEKTSEERNPVYKVSYDLHEMPVTCFSKIYNDAVNPGKDFAAIMTCGEAEENCPLIPGVELRIATTYEDPKKSDGTPQQDETYHERCRQIALETLYIFSKINY